MGNDMRLYGGSLKLNDGTDETELVRFAQEVLGDRKVKLNPNVLSEMIRPDSTLEELFGAFELAVVRDGSAQGGAQKLVSAFSAVNRYNEPEQLFKAIAPFVKDGSWLALVSDYRATTIIEFSDGIASVTNLHQDRTIEDWANRGAWPNDLRKPDNGDGAALTALVRHLTGHANLDEGRCGPAVNDRMFNMLEMSIRHSWAYRVS